MHTAPVKRLLLFDLDGTLTEPRKPISETMKSYLNNIEGASLGIVTGSDQPKVLEQLNHDQDFFDSFDYVFCENGMVGYKRGELFCSKSICEEIPQDRLNKLISFCLHYIADLDIPIKRGRFVEFRKSMINVSPVGRDCSQQERDAFYELDKIERIREKFVQKLIQEFGEQDFRFSIGGQISIDVFPVGWDKSYCLRHIVPSDFDHIHFFGDKTNKGENDYEIFIHDRVIPHRVIGPHDTIGHIEKIFVSR